MGEKMAIKVQVNAALPEYKGSVEADVINSSHAFTENSDEGLNEFEKTMLFSSKCYKIDVRLIRSNELHHLVVTVLDPEVAPILVREHVIPTSLIPLIKQTKTSLTSAGDTKFKASGVFCLYIDF